MRIINKLSMLKFSVIALFIASMATSCKPEPPAPPSPPSNGDCELKGKFTRGLCLPSIYHNFVIIEDGTDEYLVPCESVAPIPQKIEDGQRVEFSYEEIDFLDSECAKMINCDAIPDKPYRYVKITCVSVKSSTVNN